SRVVRLFIDLEFRSLISRLPQTATEPGQAPPDAPVSPDAPATAPTPAPVSVAPLPLEGLFAGLDLDDATAPAPPDGAGDANLSVRTRGGRAIKVAPPSPPLAEDEQLSLAEGAGGAAPTHAYVVDTQATLDDLLARLRRRGRFAIDLETDALNPIEAGIVGISVAAEPGIAYYIPVGHAQGTQLPCDEVLNRLRPLLEDESVEKTAHNAKFDLTVLARHGVDVRGLTFDTMIAAYLLNPSGRGYGLKDLVLAHFNVEMTDIIALIGKGKEQITMAGVDIHKAADYAAADADMTLRLQEILAPQLHEKGLYSLFRDVEMPLVSVLTAMEIAGMDVDAPYLREMSVRVQGDMDRLMAQVHEAVGHPFNIASPKQLSAVLFEELGLPSQKKTSTGYSTDAEVLETLRGKHPAVDG
ncbi:MAG: hypothetical protein LC769_12530, partial [Chloroflexi bacterium]|nr:hypothetical protein [Chloroflexota bacterium]